MSVEHCRFLCPGLKAKLQAAGFLWVEDIRHFTEAAGIGAPLSTGSTAMEFASSQATSAFMQRCPQFTFAEATEVLEALVSLPQNHSNTELLSTASLEIQSLRSLLEQEENKKVEKVTTFCRSLDIILGGGMMVGGLTEICGPPGVGKTQLLMQLAVNCTLPRRLGGLEGACLFIDTEGSFVPDRFHEIVYAAVKDVKEDTLFHDVLNAKRYGDVVLEATECGSTAECNGHMPSANPYSGAVELPRKRGRHETAATTTTATATSFTVDHVIKQTKYIRILDVLSLVAFLNLLPAYITDHPSIRMVIVDSIACPFRSFLQLGNTLPASEATGRSPPTGCVESTSPNSRGSTGMGFGCNSSAASDKQLVWRRSRLLFRCGQILQQYARELNLCIVVSNQMACRTVDNSSTEYSRTLVPAFGDVWAHALHVRIVLTHQHDALLQGDKVREGTSCYENVVLMPSNEGLVTGEDDGQNANDESDRGASSNSRVNAVQHRMARLVKSPSRPQGQCCFCISQKGIRDVLRVN
ncbi:recA bacterial DNA recombination protein Rad51 AAA domain [Trypanosoma vivax]|nr:putative recombinase rad51 [Trypanosoma vivax]KAH8617894.1 recA bacterial DNA recombination protein Rad51 AAA domain [Trypanosoma vivax]